MQQNGPPKFFWKAAAESCPSKWELVSESGFSKLLSDATPPFFKATVR
jgi:hypothetical protein